MRFRISLVFIIFTLSILISTLLMSYQTISRVEENMQTELISSITNPTLSSQEIHSRISVYQAFSKKRIIGYTRDIWKLLAIEALILGGISIYLFTGFTRPLKKLSLHLSNRRDNETGVLIPFPLQGSWEIRGLIQSYNALSTHLQEYQELVGDRSRYRGWKEISRIIVHEINNLLSPIQTYTEFLLEKTAEKDKAGHLLNKVKEIQLTLKKYHHLSHIPDAVFQPIQLTELAQEVSSEFNRVTIISGNLPLIRTDSVLCREVLRNLIKNACESHENTTVTLSFALLAGEAQITIADNGPGMNPQILENIFTPGYSTKPHHSGIGMALTQSLMNELQGRIAVRSQPGQGTQVSLFFPLFEEVNI